MRDFKAISLQDASKLPWVWELPSIFSNKPIWGINIVPTPQYTAYTTDPTGFLIGNGNPIAYTWSALLDPADTPLPDWITETTPVPAADSVSDNSSGLIGSIKSVLGL